jgi:hypothetical protein
MEDKNINRKTSELLTTEEVANLYKVYSANSLRISRYRGESKFPFIKLGKKVFYDKADIERILSNNKVK